MSELKTRFIDDTYAEYYNTGKHDLAQIHLKSEVDKYIEEIVSGAISMFRDQAKCRGLDLKSPLGKIANIGFRHWNFVQSIQNKNTQLQEDKERLLRNNCHLSDEIDVLKENVADARQKACEFQEIINETERRERHHKYKRCLAMAKWCEAEVNKCLTQQGALICFPETDRFQYLQGHFMHFSRWHKRWLKLAEKFKEAK